MRKIVALLIVAGIIFSVFFVNWFNESNHNPLDYARITEVDYRAVVVDEPGGNGKMIVTERLTFDIHAASQNNRYWELWRDLSEEYIDGVKVDYKVNSVKQIFEDGTVTTFEESPRLYWEDNDFISTARGLGPGKWYHSEGPYNEGRRQYECVFFYVDGLYRETVVFEIEYEMANAALRYNDCSELYITPYSESEIVFLQSFKGQIMIPAESMPRPGNYVAHTYGTNDGSFALTESDTLNPGYHTFLFELDKSQLTFKPYNRYIEFSLIAYGDDKHIFTRYAPENYYYNADVLDELYEEHAKYEALPGIFRIVKIIVFVVFSIAAALIIAFASRIHKRIRKRYIFYEAAEPMRYLGDIPGELDPNFAAALVFCKQRAPKNTQNGYAAVMISLVCKGYIELAKIQEDRDWDFHNVKVIVKNGPIQSPETTQTKPLTPTEELYFHLILRHANGFDLPLHTFQRKISEDYENTNAFVRKTENAIISIGISQGYFQKADYKQPAKQVKRWSMTLGIIGAFLITAGNLVSSQTRLELAFGAFFLLGIAMIIGAIRAGKSSEKYVLLTQFGEDEYAKWQGFYHYLNSMAHFQESTVTDVATWEQYLIYATAFGISEKLAATLNVQCPHMNMSPVLYNPYYRSRHFRRSHHHFRVATRSASFRARSGGFGGHGGYGGGGRGGGGGGGGH